MIYPNRIKIGEKSYPVLYEQVFKATSTVRIKKGAVVIRLSRFAQGYKRDEIIAKFLKWAVKRLEKAKSNIFIEPSYEDGGRVSTHNKIYEISVNLRRRKNARAVLAEGYLIEIHLPENTLISRQKALIKFLAEKVIMDDQTKYLLQTVDELNKLHFRKDYREVRFKRTTSRFGSCSRTGNINISLRLLFAPREVFRYVCVHELAHLVVFNHSRKFWETVGEAMPEYKKSEQWLRNGGFMLG